MALFNKLKNQVIPTVNGAERQALAQSPKMALITILLTSIGQDQYYRLAGETKLYLKKSSDDCNLSRIINYDAINNFANGLIRKTIATLTNFDSIFKRANEKYDKIIKLSNMLGWMSNGLQRKAFSVYRYKFDVNPISYTIDLRRYGDLYFPFHKIFDIAGFSLKVFYIMKIFKQDINALIIRIEAVNF